MVTSSGLSRLLNAYTQQKPGEHVSVSRQYIHQMESGVKQPAGDLPDTLCEVLKVRSGFLKPHLGTWELYGA